MDRQPRYASIFRLPDEVGFLGCAMLNSNEKEGESSLSLIPRIIGGRIAKSPLKTALQRWLKGRDGGINGSREIFRTGEGTLNRNGRTEVGGPVSQQPAHSDGHAVADDNLTYGALRLASAIGSDVSRPIGRNCYHRSCVGTPENEQTRCEPTYIRQRYRYSFGGYGASSKANDYAIIPHRCGVTQEALGGQRGYY